jgi:hypothetical protein
MRESTTAANPAGPQTFLSLLLFVHFFGIAVALSSYTMASQLQQRLLEVLPYLKTFNFDLTHTYASPAKLHLTHGSATDIDFSVEIIAHHADAESETIVIPPAGLLPPQRSRRYQALANVMGSLVGNEEVEAMLPKTVAGAILRQAGSKRGTIRIKAHYLATMDDLSSSKPERRDPLGPAFYSTVYEAQVLVSKDSVNLLKSAAVGEVAPVERSGRPSGNTKGTPAGGNRP